MANVYTEMKDSGVEWIGETPKHWNVERLQWHLNEIVEKNDPIKTENILSLTNNRGVIPYEDKGNVGNKSKDNLTEYKLAYKNTIVANSMNILIGSVGLSKYNGCVSPVYYVFESKENNDIRYFNYVFQTNVFQKELRRYANGILEIRLRLSSSDILKRKISVPPFNEQQAIADYLDKTCAEIDEIIEQSKATIEEYKAWKKSVILEVVTKGLDKNVEMKDSGVEWIGDMPSTWEIRRVKNISNELSKGNGITKEETFVDGDTPCVRYGEIYTKYDTSFTECKTRTNKAVIPSQKYFSHGDILFVGTGELVEEIGKCVTYLGTDNCLAGGDIIILKHNQCSLFLSYALNSHYAQSQKSCNKAKLKVVHISPSEIANVVIALPPLPEQQAIADYLDKTCATIDGIIAEKEALIADLQKYKKSLIFECVTGKRKVF